MEDIFDGNHLGYAKKIARVRNAGEVMEGDVKSSPASI